MSVQYTYVFMLISVLIIVLNVTQFSGELFIHSINIHFKWRNSIDYAGLRKDESIFCFIPGIFLYQ
jgi:hypothetical protein